MSKLLVPGTNPPWVVPYCRLCDMPAERFAVHGGQRIHDRLVVGGTVSAYYVEIEAQCCGKTQGKKVSVDELLRLKRDNQKLWVVVKKGAYQGVGGLVRMVSSRGPRA